MFTIIGSQGFIGSALAQRVGEFSTTPTPETKYLFYMGGCVHPDFEKNPEYWHNKIMQDFLYLLPYCEKHDIKFIYASSALVYEKDSRFSLHKKELELLASQYHNTLGLRIFPVYGKADHNTFISQAIEAMRENKPIKLFGDGKQTRSFIHIDDVISQIMMSLDKTGTIDIATGVLTSFKDILDMISESLGVKEYKIESMPYPANYPIEGVCSKNPLPITKDIYGHIKDLVLSDN